jgi:hypothetical protein
MLRRERKTKIRHLTNEDRLKLKNLIPKKDYDMLMKHDYARDSLDVAVGFDHVTIRKPSRVTLEQVSKLTSKEIRKELKEVDPLVCYKSGMILSVTETMTWGYKIKKLNLVRHRNILLRVAHGDIYTEERKYRFGITDSPNCV